MDSSDSEETLNLGALLELQHRPRLQDQLRTEKTADKSLAHMQQPVEKSKSHRAKDAGYVEANWDCKLINSLPAELKPRSPGYKGKRVGHNQQDKKRLPPGEWTKAFIRALANLSMITQDDNAYAYKKLFEQVKYRQRKRMHPEHYAREALTSDIEAVTVEVQRLTDVGRYVKHIRTQGHSDGERLGNVEVETTDGDVVNSETRRAERLKILQEPSEDGSTTVAGTQP
ncbi:hypothetical protein LTR36_010392 [Oleoguttula mirabilis]|uniref:Uncharacterized protein n=1 Tax=Oleoguttula mirabilis TaxID=1507867 RepID=A0AAV9J544_9PEZI|nr:hypothetical protein LTR36_010392 [Oleoguttula mirabilis]